MAETHLYVDNPEPWKVGLDSVQISTESLNAPSYGNAILLPARQMSGSKKVLLEGGVCDANFSFIAGLTRMQNAPRINHSCSYSYKPNGTIDYSDETVVFGGILFNHFGHFLLNTLSRLWYILSDTCPECKIVFLSYEKSKTTYLPFFDALGIPKERILLLEKPTQFRHVIVPDEAVYDIGGWGNKAWTDCFQKISNPPKNPTDKIYLTRTKLPNTEEINEKFLEDFYRDQGFQIVSPETLPFSEQIAMLSKASHIACTFGTLSHLALFANNNINLDIYLRSSSEVLLAQLLINKLKNITCNIIDATKNILPTTHAMGVYLYYPSVHFEKFVEDNKYSFKKADDKEYFSDFLYEYLCMYTKRYSKPYFFNRMSGTTFYDTINTMHQSLFGDEISIPKEENIQFKDEYNTTKTKLQVQKRNNIERINLWESLRKKRKSDILFVPFFKDEGWIFDGENKQKIQANSPLFDLRIFSDIKISYKLHYKSCGWVTLSSLEIPWSVAQPLEEAVTAVSITLAQKSDKHIQYRIFQNNAWTEFAHDGVVCGTESSDILGIQIELSAEQSLVTKLFS